MVNGTVRELVCRGKAGIALRVLKDPSDSDPSGAYVTMELTYTPASSASGTDYDGLQPGECSWNPLGLKEEPKEPGRVYFNVPREAQPWSATEERPMDTTATAGAFHPDPITLPRYLGDPDHYWVFYVDDVTHSALSFAAWKETGLPTYVMVTGRLLVDVTSAGPGGQSTTRAGAEAPADTGPRGASSTLNASKVGLTFREVVRKPNEVWLRFSARAGWRIRVMYGTQPHTYTPNTITGAPTLDRPDDGTDVPVRLMSQRGFTNEYSTAPMKNLAQGTKYYFAIFAYNEWDTRMDEYAGEFTTMMQTVTVRFTTVRILNDSDKMSAGDIGFRFFVAPATEEKVDCNPSTLCESGFYGRSWESGQSHGLGDVLTLAPSPGRIRVWVKGWDSDTRDNAAWGEVGPGGGSYSSTGGSSSLGDWNFAKREFDTGASPTQTRISYPFRLRSIDGSVFMFEVEGHVEVVRQ